MLLVALFIFACTKGLIAASETCEPDFDILTDSSIKNDQFKASAIKNFAAHKVRSNEKGSWCSDKGKPSIEITLKNEYEFKKITILGKHFKKFAIDFKFKNAPLHQVFQWFHGTSAGSNKTTVVLLRPVRADKITIRFLEDGNSHCFKIKAIGCKVIKKPIIDYCQINNTCDQVCKNRPNGVICSCFSGYSYNYTSKKCEDVNECAKGIDRCDVKTARCINYVGGYRCECLHPGLELDLFRHSCKDKNECRNNNGNCQHECVNVYKSYYCKCNEGFVLAGDNHTCLDVDECKTATLNTCDRNTTKCENTLGDFQCKCLSGLEHVGGKKSSCKDIDECQNEKGGCQYFCTNTYRSYNCSCKNNTVLDNNNHTCNDIDECSTGKHECEQECRNNYGGYFCKCNDGFNLNKDKKTCSDENECLPNGGKGVCEFKCNNTIGSYYCSCDTGYVLHNDNRTCRDFDECKARKDECDTAVSTCENNFGSYNCRCHTGYLKNSKGICVAKKCPELKPAQNGQIYPSNCMLPNTKQYKDVCNFKCDKGYELDESSAKKASCSEFGHWDLGGKFQPNCRRSRCQKVPKINNGVIIPSVCLTDGAKYKDNCQVYCNTGYRIQGNNKITCQIDLHYDETFNDTQCVKKQRIVCPRDVRLTLPTGSSSVALPLSILNLKGNIEDMDTYPPDVLTQKYKFRSDAGPQPIELFYKSERQESCIFHVTVRDKESPKVENCPKLNHYVFINQPVAKVTWPEPKFTDNVKVTKVIQNLQNNQFLSPQVYYVFYSASDEYNNHVTCRFFLHIKAKYCSKDLIPGGDSAKKTWLQPGIPNSLQVFLNCQPGSTYSTNITGIGLFNCRDGSWGNNEIPDCVKYDANENGTCAAGKRIVFKARSRKTVCANCPKGTKGVEGSCVKCEKGYYQDQEGSTSCIECPVGTTSIKDGAKKDVDCQAQCIPGSYSSTGFYASTGCTLCPEGSYQDKYGKSSCKLCPHHANTYEGATSLDDCKFPAKISSISPSQKINVFVGETINVDCFAKGNPRPFVQFQNTTELPPESFRGKKSFRPLQGKTKYEAGLRMTISQAQTYDTAGYRCVAWNNRGDLGGEDKEDIYLDVQYRT